MSQDLSAERQELVRANRWNNFAFVGVAFSTLYFAYLFGDFLHMDDADPFKDNALSISGAYTLIGFLFLLHSFYRRGELQRKLASS